MMKRTLHGSISEAPPRIGKTHPGREKSSRGVATQDGGVAGKTDRQRPQGSMLGAGGICIHGTLPICTEQSVHILP